MTSKDKLNKKRLHKASEKLIDTWESIKRLRGLMGLREHIITLQRQTIITVTDYPVSLDELEDTKLHHKVCLWSRN